MLRNYDLEAMQLQLAKLSQSRGRDNPELEIAASILDRLSKDCHRDQIETMKVMGILRTLLSEGSLFPIEKNTAWTEPETIGEQRVSHCCFYPKLIRVTTSDNDVAYFDQGRYTCYDKMMEMSSVPPARIQAILAAYYPIKFPYMAGTKTVVSITDIPQARIVCIHSLMDIHGGGGQIRDTFDGQAYRYWFDPRRPFNHGCEVTSIEKFERGLHTYRPDCLKKEGQCSD